jgi:hypothetical protein
VARRLWPFGRRIIVGAALFEGMRITATRRFLPSGRADGAHLPQEVLETLYAVGTIGSVVHGNPSGSNAEPAPLLGRIALMMPA